MLDLWFWGDLGLRSGGLVGPWPPVNMFGHFLCLLQPKVRVSEGRRQSGSDYDCGRRHEGSYVLGGDNRGDV